MAYATVANLIDRYDVNDLCDLCTDDPVGDPVTAGDLPTNGKALAALLDASGDMDSALLVGRRYTPAQLAALTGNSEAKRIRIVCARAMFYLLNRRPAFKPDLLKAFDELTETALDRLRRGENVFDIEEHQDAGLVQRAEPTVVDVSKLNQVRDRTQNYYPARRFPTN